MTKIKTEYRNRMYELCRKKGFTPAMISKLTHLYPSEVYAVLNGTKSGVEAIKTVAGILDIPYCEFLLFRYKLNVPMKSREKADLFDWLVGNNQISIL